MTRRVSRVHALVAALLLLFGSGRGFVEASCPHHGMGAAHQAPGRTTPSMPATSAGHGAMPGHMPAAPAPHGAPCHCIGDCCVSIVAALPTTATSVATISANVRIASPRPPVRAVPARVPFQLPFATAPPAVA